MLNIKYSPQRLDDKLYIKLLDDEFNHKKILTSKYQEIPEFFIAVIDEYDFNGKVKKSLELTVEAYKRFPEHFIIKRYYYYRNLEGDKDLEFEKFFAKELDCIEHNKDYGRIVSDEEMRSIIDLITTYYHENDQEQKLIELYKKLECTQNPHLLLYVGVHILKEDILNYTQYYYQHDEEVSDWLLDIDLPEGADDIHFEPKNVIFYSLLNTALDYHELFDTTSFDKLKNYEDIKHDIIWLIKQGVERANLSDCVYNIDFFVYALYLTASHEVKELYTYFFNLFLSAGDDTRDLIFGDFPNVIVSPALLKIFNGLEEEDFDPLFEDDESKWYFNCQNFTSYLY